MASRSNLSGRKDGYGRGMLSKVYNAAQKGMQANRQAGKPPGASMAKTGMFGSKRKQRLGITKEQSEAGITSVAEGREAAGLRPLGIMGQMGARGGFMGAAKRMAGKGAYAGDVSGSPLEKIKARAKSAPGLDQLTGGGEPIVAKQPPPPPPVAMNPLPPAHAPVQRGMGAEGSARLASMGVTPGAPPAASMAQPTVMPPPAPPAASFGAIGTRPDRAALPTAVEPTAAETVGAPAPAAPAERSVRSQGMHRSTDRIGSGSGGIRRRAKQDRG
jgi:hypothetical protein